MTFAHLDAVAAEVRPLAERFVDAGHRVYLVGGIVRDLWLDREPGFHLDLDLTTDATPDEIKRILTPVAEDLWLQGERFGTVGAHLDGRAYEITTHRSEAYDPDSRKPMVAFSTAVEEDLSRRDFTINAMAVEVPAVELIDPFGGADDMLGHHLRTPLDPEVSFTDDPLRMLRAARFAAGYGLVPDPSVLAAMERLAERLDIVSSERIRDEFDKLLAVADPGPGLALLARTGLLPRFLPEVTPAALAIRADTIGSVEGAELRLAALLFDRTPAAIDGRLAALRHSNERRRRTVDLVHAGQAVAAGDVSDAPALRRWVAASGALADDALDLVGAIVPGGDELVAEVNTARVVMADDLADLAVPLSGQEVMEAIGADEGPVVGRAIEHLRELRMDHGPMTAEEARHLLAGWSDPD